MFLPPSIRFLCILGLILSFNCLLVKPCMVWLHLTSQTPYTLTPHYSLSGQLTSHSSSSPNLGQSTGGTELWGNKLGWPQCFQCLNPASKHFCFPRCFKKPSIRVTCAFCYCVFFVCVCVFLLCFIVLSCYCVYHV